MLNLRGEIRNEHLVRLLVDLCAVALFIFGVNNFFGSSSFENRKVIKIPDDNQEKLNNQFLDAKALELTKDSEGALHYLHSVMINSDISRSWRITTLFRKIFRKQSIDRVAELEPHLDKLNLLLNQKNAKSFYYPIKRFGYAVLSFFLKILQFLTTPIRLLMYKC